MSPSKTETAPLASGAKMETLARMFSTALARGYSSSSRPLRLQEQGIRPEKPASGKLMLRVPPEIHGAALIAAQATGKTLNQWATEILESAAHG